jgi:hypothetical protein
MACHCLTFVVLLGVLLATTMADATACANKINSLLCSDLPLPSSAPPSPPRQDLNSIDPPPPTLVLASPLVNATISSKNCKSPLQVTLLFQTLHRRPHLPLDLDSKPFLQPPTTTIQASFVAWCTPPRRLCRSSSTDA